MGSKAKILCLLNSAPEILNTIYETYTTLTNDGFEVLLAVESNLQSRLVKLPECKTYVYSDFFEKNHFNESIKLGERYKDLNLWGMYFSDFERLDTYGKVAKDSFTERALICLVQFFDEIIERESIDYILYENVSNSFINVAYEVGRKRGVTFIGLAGSRLPGRVEILTSIFDSSKDYLRHLNEYLSSERAVTGEDHAYLKNYLADFMSSIPDYMKTNNLSVDIPLLARYLNQNKISKLVSHLKYDIEYRDQIKFAYQSSSPTYVSYRLFCRSFYRKLKSFFLPSLYDKVDEKEQYFLYPLHFHPESSTSIAAMPYVDEYNTIRNISFNLPVGTKIFVKDHPSAAGFPSLKFYRELKKLPNVRLISHNEHTKLLIKNALGVVTLTSTVGFEALILGKPVLVFGRVFYENHPNCHRVENPFYLNDQMKRMISEGAVNVPAEATVWAYYQMTASNSGKGYGDIYSAKIKELQRAK
jgi:capsule polysaccharide modification protein KpsS